MNLHSTPITDKEKMLVKILVKLYTKERLEEEFNDLLEDNSYSKIILGAGKLIGLSRDDLIHSGIQYLNYSIKNYDNIKNDIFPEEIERVAEVHLFADEKENVVQYNRKRLKIYLLPSTIEKSSEVIYNNFYQYDPDTIDVDYGDSDFISFTPTPEDTKIFLSTKNVIN